MNSRTGNVDGLSEKEIVNAENLIIDAQFLIQELLDRKGMTRADLAKAASLKKSYVTALMGPNANPTIRTLSKIFTALGEALHLKCQQKPTEMEISRHEETSWEISISKPRRAELADQSTTIARREYFARVKVSQIASNENHTFQGEDCLAAAA